MPAASVSCRNRGRDMGRINLLLRKAFVNKRSAKMPKELREK
jgi:hypothetical protein